MSRELIVAFACNDHRNGQFTGRAYFCAFENAAGEFADFAHDNFEHGVALTVDYELGELRLHRAIYRFTGFIEWRGNWCWNAYRMPRAEGLRLLLAVNAREEWHLEGGTDRVCDWLDRRAGRPRAFVLPGKAAA